MSHIVTFLDGQNEVAVGDGNGLPVVAAKGTATVKPNVASSVTSVVLLAANANRINAEIVNHSATAVLYICKDGTDATLEHWSQYLNPGDSCVIDDTDQAITGIWSAAVGHAHVTETVV